VRVSAIEVIGGQTHVTTEYAGLEDAVLQADVTVTDQEIGAGDMTGADTLEQNTVGASRKTMSEVNVSGGVGRETKFEISETLKGSDTDPDTGVSYSVSGTAKAGVKISTKLTAAIKVSWPDIRVWKGKVDLFSIEFKEDKTVYSSISIAGSVTKTFTKEFPSVHIGAFSIGVVPVTVSLDPYMKATFSANGKVSLNSEVGSTWRVGPKYQNGSWSLVNERSKSNKVLQPSIEAGIGVKAEAGIDLTVKICGLAGPYVGVEVWAEATGKVVDATKASIDVSLGIGAYVGAKAELSIGPFSKTIADWRTTIAATSGQVAHQEVALAVTPTTPSPTPSSRRGGGQTPDGPGGWD
jgi:hypothetical protein